MTRFAAITKRRLSAYTSTDKRTSGETKHSRSRRNPGYKALNEKVQSMLELISVLWLPVAILAAAVAVGGLSWFFFVRSIDIPWDDRNRK